ncbi:VPLPA-CTERM sorting domain-containing protein [Boseongicola aestuarii]|uniref:VPLPA-CTERM protein sorting domain protein n=1 Tax=Boseongicola aestuarii TaxID=1470561 RepID=A0A238IY48_9RHOB|nr:VPLPA-CTERM sorting domain-containing protein [Boseongicola aestuarii]SMX22594.1 hypothetical protein BOA8489_00692 [Boseongicola aestuarii]
MNIKTLTVAALLAAAAPLASVAATIQGEIEIGGEVSLASLNDFTGVDFIGDGIVIVSAGDLSFAKGTAVTLTDIDFSSPGDIWSVGLFSFVATSFSDILANGFGGKDFEAQGVLSAAGFDNTEGTFRFSSQSGRTLASFSSSSFTTPIPLPAAGWLLIGGLGGLAAMKRRKKA